MLSTYLRCVALTGGVTMRGYPSRPTLVGLWHEDLFYGLVSVGQRKSVAVYVHEDAADLMTIDAIEAAGCRALVGRRDERWGIELGRHWLSNPGHILAITVDGPLGPARVVKPGALRLARALGVPFLPLRVRAGARHRVRRWDRAKAPELFDQFVVEFGDAVEPSRQLTPDLRRVEEWMSGSTAEVMPNCRPAALRAIARRVFEPLNEPPFVWPQRVTGRSPETVMLEPPHGNDPCR